LASSGPVFSGFRPPWLLAGALWLSSGAWSHTVLENTALLGMSHEQVAEKLVDAQPVRSPRRLPSGALGSLRVPDALCEGAHFEQTLFFAQQKLTRMDLVLISPGAEDAVSRIQAALLQSLRARLGPELAAGDSASWASADADVMLFRSGRPDHPSLRMVIKQRQLVDAGEL
jgi:hypothetical protein